jgi:ABC-type bacteriocin/lantibiotic exporter with double-glycine peptidase domain
MQLLRGILSVPDRKERAKMFVLIFWDIIISALDIIFLGLTVIVINFYVRDSPSKYLSFLPAKLNDKNSVLLIAVFFVLFGIKNLLAWRVSASEYSFIYRVASRLSRRNMYDYLRSGYMQYVNIDSSVQIRKISQQPIEFSTYILTNFQQIISQSVLVIFTVVAVLWYHASLFVLLFLLLMPAVSILGWILKRRLKNVRRNIKKTGEETLKTLHEALASYIESNIYDRNDFFAERYYRQQEQLNHNIRVQQTLQALPSRLIEIFAILGFLILIVLNKLAGSNAPVDLLTIGVFLAAAYKIIPGVVKILNSAGQMRTYEFTIHDLQASDNEYKETMAPFSAHIHSINIDKICFSYNHKPLLRSLSADILPGDFVGISSHSGKGKTTFINILLGFLSQKDGIICINSRIMNADDRKNYRNHISYIKQQPFFIHDTIARNITLSDDDSDTGKLQEVADFCDLDVIIDQHSEGLGWIITENGKNLSGGQRQRVMLARALYHGFDLLVLDEPFGELDQQSENIILEKLQILAAEGKMILLVTHNRQSLSYCNKIISLDEQG